MNDFKPGGGEIAIGSTKTTFIAGPGLSGCIQEADIRDLEEFQGERHALVRGKGLEDLWNK